MKSELEIEAERPKELQRIIGLSLQSNNKVQYQIESKEDSLNVKIDTDGLGPLRGCTDTAFRLVSLAKKLY